MIKAPSHNRKSRKLSALEKIDKREIEIKKWIFDNASEVLCDQKQLDEKSEARSYWHYGYAQALTDIRKLLAQ